MDGETQTNPVQSLSPLQHRAAALIASGCTQVEAARLIGRHQWTINRWWCTHPVFRAEVERLIAEAQSEVLAHLPDLARSAIKTLEAILDSPFISDNKAKTARFIVDRLLMLSVYLAQHSDSGNDAPRDNNLGGEQPNNQAT